MEDNAKDKAKDEERRQRRRSRILQNRKAIPGKRRKEEREKSAKKGLEFTQNQSTSRLLRRTINGANDCEDDDHL